MTTTAPDSVLSAAECIRLLRSVPVGRMVFTENAAPALRPVTFAAVGGEVVIPTDDESFARFDGGVSRLRSGRHRSDHPNRVECHCHGPRHVRVLRRFRGQIP